MTHVRAVRGGHRQLHMMLDAYRAERAHPLPDPPMTDEQLYDAMVQLNSTDQAR